MILAALAACTLIDETELDARLADLDLDGFPAREAGGADCDDDDPAISPNAEEVCDDGVDQDCDGGAGACRAEGEVSLADADATWSGADAGDYLGARVAVLADEDGGGTAVVAGPLHDDPEVDIGVVWLFERVVADRPLSGADARLVGPGADAGFGNGLAAAGDVDGDGAEDLLVGASFFAEAATHAGGAWLFSGPVRGDHTAESADARILGTEASGMAGFALAGVGDVDADGDGEVLVAASGNSAGAGELWLFRGPVVGERSGADPDLRVVGVEASAGLGSSVATADVDGDGVPEIWAGAHSSTSVEGYGYAGAAWLLDAEALGTTTTADATAEVRGLQADGLFGYRVAAPGDVDLDGYDDLVATAPGLGDGGTVLLFRGPLAGAWTEDDVDARWEGEVGESLGIGIAGAGDVDGDGWPDMVAGVGSADGTAAGAARLIYGPLARGGVATLDLVGVEAGDSAGWDVAAGGDMTGDGVPDLLIGAWATSGAAGAAYLWAGAGL